MNRQLFAALMLSISIWIVGCSGKSQPTPTGSELEIRAVSLKNLQKELKDCQMKGNCSAEVSSLANLKIIHGIILDENNNDAILLGQTDSSLPPLYTEDLAIALRNAWLKYAPLESGVYQYSFPGCSIDPTAEVVRQLQSVERQLGGRFSSPAIEKAIQTWRDVCQQSQTVRVMGIPFDSHFAQVMVKADYDLKILADGSDALETPGFISIANMRFQQARNAVLNQGPLISQSGMSRFWLYPQDNVYQQDQGLFLIKQCPVKLLTEHMHSNTRGETTGAGYADYFANIFANNFTTLYEEIAQSRPVYMELENLFRFVALAAILKSHSDSQVPVDLSYLLEEYPIPRTPVDHLLPGRHAVKEFRHQTGDQFRQTTIQLWLPSCGGVDIAIDEKKRQSYQDTTGALSALKAAILNARPSAATLYWDYKDAGSRLSDLQNDSRINQLNRANRHSSVLSISYKPDGYIIYDGASDPIYSGMDMSKLAAAVSKKLDSTPDKILCFDLKDFPNENKKNAFLASYEIQTMKEAGKIRFLPARQEGSTEAQDVLRFPGVRLDEQSTEISEITEGKFTGWTKLKMNFLVQLKGVIRKAKITVIAKTSALAQAFLQKITGRLTTQNFAAESLTDIVMEIHKELKGDTEENRIFVYDEFESTQISRLTATAAEAIAS